MIIHWNVPELQVKSFTVYNNETRLRGNLRRKTIRMIQIWLMAIRNWFIYKFKVKGFTWEYFKSNKNIVNCIFNAINVINYHIPKCIMPNIICNNTKFCSYSMILAWLRKNQFLFPEYLYSVCLHICICIQISSPC